MESHQSQLETCWTITIHKSPGFTISNAVIDLGPTEKVADLAYVALPRVCKISDLILEPTTLEKNLNKKLLFNFSRCSINIPEERKLFTVVNKYTRQKSTP